MSRLTSRSETTRDAPADAWVPGELRAQHTGTEVDLAPEVADLGPLGRWPASRNTSSPTASSIDLASGALSIDWPVRGECVGGLGVDDRERLVEAVDVRAGRLRVGRPVGAQPEVAVADREQRPAQPAVVVTEAASRPAARCRPGSDRDRSRSSVQLPLHASVSSRSSTTMSAPASTERFAVAAAIDADHEREVAGVPGGDARDRVLDDDRLARRRRRGTGRRGGTSPDRAFRRDAVRPTCCRRRRLAKRSLDARRRAAPCGRSSTTTRSRSVSPSASSMVHHRQRSRIRLDPLPGEHGVEHLVLAIAQRTDRVVARRVGRVAPRRARRRVTRGTSARRRIAVGRRRRRGSRRS